MLAQICVGHKCKYRLLVISKSVVNVDEECSFGKEQTQTQYNIKYKFERTRLRKWEQTAAAPDHLTVKTFSKIVTL